MPALLWLGLLRGTKAKGRSVPWGGPLLSPGRDPSAVPGALWSGASPRCRQQPWPALPMSMALPAAEGLHGAAASSSWHLRGLGEKLPWGGGTSAMDSIPLLACSCPFKMHVTFSHRQRENCTSPGSGLEQSSAGGTKCI